MWGLTPEFLATLEERLEEFFQNLKDEMKGEYLLVIYIG
jgi:hypothetical protein